MKECHLVIYLRFIFYFRNYLPQGDLILWAKHIATLLGVPAGTPNRKLLQMALSLTLNAIITIKAGLPKSLLETAPPFFDRDSLSPEAPFILEKIYHAVKNIDEVPDISLLKTIYELTVKIKENAAQLAQPYSEIYVILLKRVIAQGFDFDLIFAIFEGIGALYHYTNVYYFYSAVSNIIF